MQSSLKKSLYLGLAALSFASVAAVSTNASAKSYAKAGAETDLTVTKKDTNVESTGTNALFTKPGTTKGAKVVASKAKMKKMANSGKSADYFWAYRTTTTNKGAVYYKVVSMNGKYRGYVYAGRAEGEFNRGLKKADTTTPETNPTKLVGYKLKNVAKNTLWTAPKNTAHKAKTVSLYGVPADSNFTVDKAESKTREGTLYYHVTSDVNPKVSGWIYAGKGYNSSLADDKQSMGGLSFVVSDASATENNSVKVIYRDADKKQVSASTWVSSSLTSKAGDTVVTTGDKADANAAGDSLQTYATKNVPSGYELANANYTVPATQYGQTIYVDVTATAASTVKLNIDKVVNTVTDNTVDPATTDVDVTAPLKVGDVLAAKDVTVTGFDSSVLKGTKGADAGVATIGRDLEGATYVGTKTYFDKTGASYHYNYSVTKNGVFATDNRTAKVGDSLNLYLTATLQKDAATGNTDNGSWIN